MELPSASRRYADQRSSERYRPELDGLRAVAVLGVMIYHAGFGLTGGFIGIDVFFVLSGFLITGKVLEELKAGNFSLQQFWERRIRRILPASIATIIVVLASGYFLLSPYDYTKLAQAALCQIFFVGNIFHWMDTSYFAGQAELKPLLHTWSLAIEEQFYFLLPILLWIPFRRKGANTYRILTWLAVASLTASILLTAQAPSTAFYLLPTRAWELLVGSLIAFHGSDAKLVKRIEDRGVFWLTTVVATAAMLILVAAMFFMQANQGFPGYMACIPVGCTAVLIYLHGQRTTWVSVVLASKLLVGIGLISYSLYLWHWPLMAFTRYALPLAAFEVMLLPLMASFPIAFLSWKWIECPFRNPEWRGAWLWSFAGCALLIPTIGSMLVWQQEGFPQRVASGKSIPPPPADLLNARYRTSPVDFALPELPLLGDANAEPRFIVWGDSHAMALAPLVDEIAIEYRLSFYLVARGGVPPLANSWRGDASPFDRSQCVQWNSNVLEAIQAAEFESVLVVAGWQIYMDETGLNDEATTSGSRESTREVLRRQIARTADSFSDGTKVFWLSPAPRQSADLARVVQNRALNSWSAELPNGLTRSEYETQVSDVAAAVNDLDNWNFVWLDASSSCFDSSGNAVLFVDDQFCYVDDNHVSMAGARLYFEDAIRKVMESIGDGKSN